MEQAPRASAWRAADEVLLQRLEDETLALELFAFLTRATPAAAETALHPRAGGLVSELRKRPGGTAAVTAALAPRCDLAGLARFVDGLRMRECAPELLHHLALFHAKGAAFLEASSPETAANAWVRSLAAWLALATERVYLARLEDA